MSLPILTIKTILVDFCYCKENVTPNATKAILVVCDAEADHDKLSLYTFDREIELLNYVTLSQSRDYTTISTW